MKPNTENLEKVTPDTIGKVKRAVQKAYGNNDMETDDKTQEEKGVLVLHNAKALKGYKLNSLDGEIGRVKEFYFDDRHWAVRYLVADTGNWLTGLRVLISPYALTAVNKEEQHIAVDLTKKQIEESPSLYSDKPVSRQFEIFYNGYYGYPLYWTGEYMWGFNPYIVRDSEKWAAVTQGEKVWDSHLRSTHDVSNHNIMAVDGEIGHVDRLLQNRIGHKIS
jgi:hypothetical protein